MDKNIKIIMLERIFEITFTRDIQTPLFKPNDCNALQTPCVK